MMNHVEAMVSSYPEEFRTVIDYTVNDHGVSIFDHPHISSFYGAVHHAGGVVRYNPTVAAMRCVLPDDYFGDWPGEVDYNVLVPDVDMHANALPKTFPNNVVRGIAVMQLLWDIVGHFPNCREEE